MCSYNSPHFVISASTRHVEEADDRATASCPDPDAAERNQKVGSWFICTVVIGSNVHYGYTRLALEEKLLR